MESREGFKMRNFIVCTLKKSKLVIVLKKGLMQMEERRRIVSIIKSVKMYFLCDIEISDYHKCKFKS